jgi:hypothetical protein
MIHLFARPHVLSWLFTVIWFQLLDSSESANPAASQRRLWYLPALMLLWVNLHGGFVLGFALLGLYLLSAVVRYYRSRDGEESRSLAQRSKTLGMVTVASLAASPDQSVRL